MCRNSEIRIIVGDFNDDERSFSSPNVLSRLWFIEVQKESIETLLFITIVARGDQGGLMP